MRVLITGASGFAGRHLARLCSQAGDEVVGLSRSGAVPDGCAEGRSIDLRDEAAVRATLRSVRPAVVYHLAALSSVARSWEDPPRTINDNVSGAVSLLEGLRHEAPGARVVWVSSCQVYGSPEQLPITEQFPVSPADPYSVSKTAGDLLAGVYAEAFGLDLVRARPFNHAGPGQRPVFIVSSLAEQAARARLEAATRLRLRTGNPDARRDFTDVRDVVRAYRLLAGLDDRGIYNISSGASVSARELVALLGTVLAPLGVEHVVDPARVRAHEVMDIRGDHARLSAATGWQPQIPLEQTVRDTLEWWERELSALPARRAVRD